MSAPLHTEKTIFLEAAEISSPTLRAAFLERSCGDDQQLRAAVEGLLVSHQRSQGVLDAAEAPLVEHPATIIGPYKLLQQIGEGGMGVVFMAEQTEPIARKVALKIIKPGMDSRQVIARFEAERQALAMMDHVNIARVLDAGTTPDGLPYFVMELVHGVPITKYCDDNHLTPRERLELFVPVCQAIQHAHQKGIIHRDIKPTNVMVTLYDGKPVPKVIDFGVAKATEQKLTERTLFTHFGTMVGTLEYMSPEQAEMSALGADTRSDIYSLGVLLYELLTGSTPLSNKRMKDAAYAEILRMIKEDEPPKPSTRLSESGEALASISALRHMEPAKLTNLIRGELDWIVMKTLEKDRNRRYETANDFAADVQRYLNDETVQACPPSASYRFRKFVRRNRGPAITTALIAVTLVIGAALSTWQALRATRAEQQAIQDRDDKEQARHEAVTSANQAQEAADAERQARDAAVTAKLQATLQLADNYTSRGLEDSNATWNARAALWFANAAVTSRDDPQRVRANLIRVNNWLQGQWTPVAAFGQADNGDNQLTFDPENSRYLLTFRQRGTIDAPPQIWDLVTEQPLHPSGAFDPPSDAVWASRGQVLLASPGGHVALASMPDLKILHQWDAGGPVKHVAAAIDGRFVAAASGKKLLVWEVSGQGDPAIAEHPAEIVYLGFSPTTTQLVTATDREAKARLFSIESSDSSAPKLRQVLGPVTHMFRGTGAASTDYFTKPPVFADEGRVLVTIQENGTKQLPGQIKWYDTASGAELATTEGTRLSEPRAMAVSRDGRMVAVADALYDARTRRQAQTFTNVVNMAFGPNGGLFAISDAGVEVYKIEPGKSKSRVFPIVNRGAQPAFSGDGKYMAILDFGVVQVFRVPTTSSSAPLSHKVHLDGGFTWAAFSPDGQYTMPIGKTAGSTTVKTIQVCTTASGEPVGEALALDAELISADFSPNSQLVAAVTGKHEDPRQLRIWNWRTGTLACTPFQFDSEPVSTCFAPDGKAVAVHGMNGRAILVDPSTGGELLRVKCGATRTVEGSYPWMSGRGTISFSRDGKTFFTWGSRVVQAWDRTTGQERYAVKHRLDCWAFAQSPDGRVLATGSPDGSLCLWDADSGKELRPAIEHPGHVVAIDFSRDGQLVATACNDWQTRVWEVATGKLAYAMSPGGWLTDVRFTPDGRFVVNAGASGIQVWDAKTGYAITKRAATGTGEFPLLDLTPDGHWALVSGTSNFFQVIDLQSLTGVAKSSPEESLLWAELLCNSRINGSTIVNLSNTEWLDRWRQYRRQHPEFRPLEERASP